MTNERTVPLLPCASIDDIETFYGVLGFRTTYRERKPNACVGVQREELHLQFFEIAGFDPEQSYGSCLVLTADIEGLHRAFAAGMRAAYGRVLVSGTPRMTRPRARKNADGLGGFSVIELNSGKIEKWNPAAPTASGSVPRLVSTWNFGAVTAAQSGPTFSGDILGDWREEAVYTNAAFNELIIFTTNVPSNTRLYTLAHNPAYRNAMTFKGYMQSHHVDYYLGANMATPPRPNITYTPR